MTKNLRSLIHEKFPVDLRVSIDLLSRRRDIMNAEKQEELIKLLQRNNISNITQLGPGTNRYAFKMDGFVIKVATDHDGKIDNLKEFKMAKRLYPYVAKTYEVSENGTILVAEYIQPFESYTEMCKYAERIREILTKLSTVYLIGDVGITSKNYSNWGIRVGTNDPVCLDFAYVYEVSSELFLCRHCNANAMLVPNRDFTELHCSNPACGKRYLFEDIRARIGNDLHKHEIGDLSEEGYRLTESNVMTELNEQRSNYLARKKEKHKVVTPKNQINEEIKYDDFVMAHEPKFYINLEEETTMNEGKGRISNAIAVASGLAESQGNKSWKIIPATAIPIDTGRDVSQATAVQYPSGDDIYHEPEITIPNASQSIGRIDLDKFVTTSPRSEAAINEEVAFSGSLEVHATPIPVDEEDVMAPEVSVLTTPGAPLVVKEDHHLPVEPISVDVTVAIKTEDLNPQVIAKSTVEKTLATVDEEKKVEPAPKKQNEKKGKFTDRFVNNLNKAISVLSNKIGTHLHVIDAFGSVKGHVKDKKMYPETFYKSVQNAVFRSIVSFCDFTEVDVPNQNGKGTHKEFNPPAKLEGTPYEPTLIFIERMWNIREINSIENAEDAMAKYRSMFSDNTGIQYEWLEGFKARMLEKMPIDRAGADAIAEMVGNLWCAFTNNEETEGSNDEAAAEDPNEEMLKEAIELINGFVLDNCSHDADFSDMEHIEIAATESVYGDHQIRVEVDLKNFVLRQFIDDTEAKTVQYNDLREFIDNELNVLDFYPLVHTIYDDPETAGINTEEEVAFSGSMEDPVTTAINMESSEVIQNPEDDEAYEDEESVEPEYLSVEIYLEDDFDVVKVRSGEAFGPISIPFYTKLDEVSVDQSVPSVVDDRNGVWDWLINMVPDLMFTTSNPDYWLQINDVDLEEQQAHVVILNDNEDGTYVMGIYYVSGIYIVDDEGNMEANFDYDLLAKINRLVCENIGYGVISHLRRSLSMTDLIYSEDYIKMTIVGEEDSSESEYEPEAQEQAGNELEDAAIAALMGDNKTEAPVEESISEDQSQDEESPVDNEQSEEVAQEEDPSADEAVHDEVEQPAQQTFKPIRRKRN